MNQQPLERYRVLLAQLMFERAAAGGELPEAEESRFVTLLDELWWQLGPADREKVERELARSQD